MPLWKDLVLFYDQVLGLWNQVAANGKSINSYRVQLQHLRWISEDRVELYSLSDRPRPRY